MNTVTYDEIKKIADSYAKTNGVHMIRFTGGPIILETEDTYGLIFQIDMEGTEPIDFRLDFNKAK